MKYLVVLLFFISVVYSHPHPSPLPIAAFPVFYFDAYEVKDPVFDITMIGAVPLECRTDLDTCCGMNQGFHRGNWYSPNGQRLELETSSDRNHMYQTRLASKVNLHRDGDNVQEGKYCCKIETNAVHREEKGDKHVTEEKCIKLFNYTRGECFIMVIYVFLHCTVLYIGPCINFVCCIHHIQ